MTRGVNYEYLEDGISPEDFLNEASLEKFTTKRLLDYYRKFRDVYYNAYSRITCEGDFCYNELNENYKEELDIWNDYKNCIKAILDKREHVSK